MAVNPEIEHLRARHHALDEAIEQENSRPVPDELRIASLKKQKLNIKDEILKLETATA
ncbi:MAG TPA: YdcH family protein [Alphaproteobacteria bacterium]|nr:YdcH family protein [Alphaproteobacteria bacterium]